MLYVTVSEVLPRERAQWHQVDNKKSAGIVQFVAVSIGFGAMCVLAKCLRKYFLLYVASFTHN